MCRKCIKSDVCHHKFAMGQPIMAVLKTKEGDAPEGMKEGRAVSLKEFEDVMDNIADKCQFFKPIPVMKSADNIGDMK